MSWSSQVWQYSHEGEPGIRLEKHDLPVAEGTTTVDCLLYRDEHGVLVGILNHYNENNPWESPGALNVWVRPNRQRQGIGTELLREANRLWKLDNDVLQYTMEGDLWIDALVNKGKIDAQRTRSLE